MTKKPNPFADTDDVPPVAPSPVVAVVPASAEVDWDLVDRAVDDVNRIYTAKGLEAARAIGEYLTQHFFGGDLDAVGGFGPTGERHRSFRALGERADLQVSHAHLWACVRILGQLRLLPDDVASALPLSHHRRLLTVRDPATKVALAKKAVDRGLTVRALEAEVAKVKAKESPGKKRPGRAALPGFVKAVRALGRLDLGLAGVSDEVFDALGEEEVGDLVSIIDGKMAALQELKGRIGRRLG